jgi:hypothetical protein
VVCVLQEKTNEGQTLHKNLCDQTRALTIESHFVRQPRMIGGVRSGGRRNASRALVPARSSNYACAYAQWFASTRISNKELSQVTDVISCF